VGGLRLVRTYVGAMERGERNVPLDDILATLSCSPDEAKCAAK